MYRIELSKELYEAALVRFNRDKNVKLVQGDSGQKLQEILKEITRPALFWLDGHYTSPQTAMGVTSTPIGDELEGVLSHPVKKHVILIDDARLFDGSNDYPKLDEVLRLIREGGRYRVEVSTDIIRIVPLAR